MSGENSVNILEKASDRFGDESKIKDVFSIVMETGDAQIKKHL